LIGLAVYLAVVLGRGVVSIKVERHEAKGLLDRLAGLAFPGKDAGRREQATEQANSTPHPLFTTT